ncbi:MAG: hypothetical protein GPJ54_05365 [Candidatus Heimdallarchaeota archaeon]|nr:hypothetical protein [Candidatus Heimdallarchaeota archaeon]
MNEQLQLSANQLGLLTQFVTKHNILEIKLNQAESRYFFDFLEQGSELENSRILLQPAFAEGRLRDKNGDLGIVIIPKGHLFNSSEVQWEDGFDYAVNVHTNPFTLKLLEMFTTKMGYEILLTKLADELKELYPLSQGQAKAVMIKLLGFRLSSGTRSFLHDLRTKIRRYQGLIINFQEYVILSSDDVKLTPQTFSDELLSKFSDTDIPNHLLKIKQEKRLSGHDDRTQQLLKRQAEIVQSKELPKIEKSYYLQNPPNYEFVCLECKETISIKPEQLETDDILQTPDHCENSMTVRLKS